MTLHQKTVRNNATFVTHLVRYCLMNHLENSLRPCTFIGNKLASPPQLSHIKANVNEISVLTQKVTLCQTSFYKYVKPLFTNDIVDLKTKWCVWGGGGFLFLWRRGGGLSYSNPTLFLLLYVWMCTKSKHEVPASIKTFSTKNFY